MLNVTDHKFELMNEPVSYQLSIRISNMAETYGTKGFLNSLRDALEVDEFSVFDEVETVALPTMYVNIVQIIRYFGRDKVSQYITMVYGEAVAS